MLTLFIQYQHTFVSALISVFATVFSIFLLKPLATHIGLVDMPGGRKTHVNSIPLIGGISLFIGFCFMLMSLKYSLLPYRGLLAGSAILLLIGVLDDLHELKPKIRLVGQLLAVICLIHWGHMKVSNLGDLFFMGVTHVTLLSYVITFISVLMFINATNMIDGHDGLAGSVVLGQLLCFVPLTWWFTSSADSIILTLSVLLLCVFLFFNFPAPWRQRAQIFLGDAGSTFLGFFVAWFAVSLSQAMLDSHLHVPGYNLFTILWILAYPIFDFLSVFIYRLQQGRSPFSADRDHMHHLLLTRGVSPGMVSVLLFFLSISFAAVAFLLAYLRVIEGGQLLGYLAIFVIYLLVCHYLRESLIKKQAC